MIELAEHPARILEVIIRWAKLHQDVRGVALVRSHARGTARLDSDIDLVLLAVNREALRADSAWIEAIDWSGAGVKVANWGDEDYGAVWSRRVRLSSGVEVEISFAPVVWASMAPLDAGTRRVISAHLPPIGKRLIVEGFPFGWLVVPLFAMLLSVM